MRTAAALSVLLAWQLGSPEGLGPATEPSHLRYQRSVQSSSAGQNCAVLDAAVFAHAASGAGNDLRLFNAQGMEIPFGISISESQPAEVETARVKNLLAHQGDIAFDLQMPPRLYTDVVLDVVAKDFVATAQVSSGAQQLGSYTIFDMSGEHLGRSTTLPLQEAGFPELHVALHLSKGATVLVRGAQVPPSREAQTLTTSVVDSITWSQRGSETVATLRIPAHVPVEQAAFALDPKYAKNFSRIVRITARPDQAADSEDVEQVIGNISRVRVVEQGIDVQHMAVPAVFGANLGGGATVEVAIENGVLGPLPWKAVSLRMRQRMLCFAATANQSYLLRYGDAALHAPVYKFGDTTAKPALATLGVEQVNSTYVERREVRTYTERHPELIWMGLLAVFAALGGLALHGAKRQGRRR